MYLILLYHIIQYDINQLYTFLLMSNFPEVEPCTSFTKEVLALGIRIDREMALLMKKAMHTTLSGTTHRAEHIFSPVAAACTERALVAVSDGTSPIAPKAAAESASITPTESDASTRQPDTAVIDWTLNMIKVGDKRMLILPGAIVTEIPLSDHVLEFLCSQGFVSRDTFTSKGGSYSSDVAFVACLYDILFFRGVDEDTILCFMNRAKYLVPNMLAPSVVIAQHRQTSSLNCPLLIQCQVRTWLDFAEQTYKSPMNVQIISAAAHKG